MARTNYNRGMTKSGVKFRNADGIHAIKDGIKANSAASSAAGPKPPWLRVRLGGGPGFQKVRRTVTEHGLSTVCQESHCPNIGECWNRGTATIMLMGSVCTRACRFCAVDTGNPNGRLDADEPRHAAESVRLMGLKYVVLTSVDRDDLADGGAGHYAACVRAIKRLNPGIGVEALTPDFAGDHAAVETVVTSGIDVFAQNLETVERLTHPVRDVRAGYAQTLDVLHHAKVPRPSVLTKSSLMLGLGETDDEIRQAMDDLRRRRRRCPDPGTVSAPHREPSPRRAVGASRSICRVPRAGSRARLHRSRGGTPCAVQLSSRAHPRRQQSRIDSRRIGVMPGTLWAIDGLRAVQPDGLFRFDGAFRENSMVSPVFRHINHVRKG